LNFKNQAICKIKQFEFKFNFFATEMGVPVASPVCMLPKARGITCAKTKREVKVLRFYYLKKFI
jgi:hypothetical protein